MLKGYISNAEDRTEILYNHPDNAKTVKYTPKVNAQTMIDYINKQSKSLCKNGLKAPQKTNESF